MVSIIVPVYKVEKYMRVCVDSILAQTYTNFELILVDDGSPDACGSICDEYAAIEPRVRVIHKQNGGLSDARNAGIDAAKGDYICFVDSDDLIHASFLKSLMDGINAYGADIAACKPLLFEDGNDPVWVSTDSDIALLDRYQALESIFQPQPEWIIVTSCAKVFSRRVIDTLRFPVGRQHEDEFTTYRFFYNAQKLLFVESKLYGYRIRSGSITNQTFRPQRLDAIDAAREAVCFIGEQCPSLLPQVHCYLISICLHMINQMISEDYPDNTLIKRLRKEIFDSCRPACNPYLTKRQKIWLIILRSNIALYKVLFRLRTKQHQTVRGDTHGQ